MSWNYCNNDENRMSYSISKCLLRELGGCKDMVSKFFCNKHCAYFGLTHKQVTLVNGNNDIWSEIVVYILSSENFRLPLFFDNEQNLMLSELQSYCQTISAQHPEVKPDKLAHIIGCLMGVSVNATKSCGGIGGWIDNENSKLIAEINERPMEVNTLSLFHKALLYYAKPAFAGEDIVRVPNIVLRQDQSNLIDGNNLAFVIAEKTALLKYTGEPTSIATPLVLLAYTTFTSNNGISILYRQNGLCS